MWMGRVRKLKTQSLRTCFPGRKSLELLQGVRLARGARSCIAFLTACKWLTYIIMCTLPVLYGSIFWFPDD